MFVHPCEETCHQLFKRRKHMQGNCQARLNLPEYLRVRQYLCSSNVFLEGGITSPTPSHY